MKFIGKLLLYIFIALLVLIAGLYSANPLGSRTYQHGFPKDADYHLAFGAMDHRFSAISYRAGERHVWP